MAYQTSVFGFTLMLSHSPVFTNACVPSFRAWLSIFWCPAVCCPAVCCLSGAHPRGLGGSAGCWQHTRQYRCSQPALGALHASPVCEHVQELLAGVPCSPSTAMGRDTGLRIETKTSPGKKPVSNCLEVPCIHCPEADNGGWAGFSPVTQGLQLLGC